MTEDEEQEPANKDANQSYVEFNSGNASGSYGEGEVMELTPVVCSVLADDTYTLSQAVNALGFGKFQLRLSLFTGLCWMSDSMEMTLLSILAPALHCDWGISSAQQALVTTMVFVGMMLSATFWGNFSDRYGRKKGLVVSSILLCYYGLLSSIAPTFFWLLFLRLLVGFAAGCVPQAVTLYAEFLPTKHRGKCLVLLECFWSFGACLEVILALAVMGTLGWRGLLALSCLPAMLFLSVAWWLPESIRFLSLSGRTEEAEQTLSLIAKENGCPELLGRLTVDDLHQTARRGRAWDLLRPSLRRTTLLLWLIWITCSFCYYGLVLMSTELLVGIDGADVGGTCITGISRGKEGTCHAACRPLSTHSYLDLLWTTIGEFPGIFLTVCIIERLGRKKTIALEFLAFFFIMGAFLFCLKSRALITVLLFLARGIVSGVFQAAYVYTPEVYPTSLRAVGVGTCNGMARIGAMITPYVAQVVLSWSLRVAVSIYSGVSLVALCAVMFLPLETKGRDLDSTPEEQINNTQQASNNN